MAIRSRIKRLEEVRGPGGIVVFQAPDGNEIDAELEAYCQRTGRNPDDLLVVVIRDFVAGEDGEVKFIAAH